ncbi:hypothetical protein [Nocardioides deserti]|uniref:Uncharacterized protein n=1 Tax=Nocardioides deserti TaxID=1588644 RepID=A0ABR6UC40_9ACTN|nr:hypothetical protein [Nocardioides deserti]MBC2961718.1 hypothetical protein [Nocardioides deserti]GGO73051.1 hypothetical protein GCM10012276_17720 [Nocardioides deserti]
MTEEQRATLGEELATWIERLGLEGHLTEAGLPTFRRDGGAGSAARWIDPGTGQDLSLAQLQDVERLLRNEGTEPEHAVPVALVVLRRHARLRAELLATPTFDYAALAEVRGTSVDATRFAVHKAASTHRLLVVPVDERSVVPAFQLTGEGELRPDLAPVLEPLLAARMDPWRVWAWLTQPAALLGGLVPEQAVTDPETADLVLTAAVRLAERVAAGS